MTNTMTAVLLLYVQWVVHSYRRELRAASAAGGEARSADPGAEAAGVGKPEQV